MGQSNVCYPLEADGTPKNAAWMVKAVDYVRSCAGENVLFNEVADVGEDTAAEAEKALSRAQGRWVANARQRIRRTEFALELTEEMLAENIALRSRMRTAVEAAGRLVKIDPPRTT